MVRRCIIPHCHAKRGEQKYKHLSFHEIPSDSFLREKWLRFIMESYGEDSEIITTDHTVVCSRHFLPEDFRQNCNKFKRLNVGSVPSVFSEHSYYDYESMQENERENSTDQCTSGKVQKLSFTGRGLANLNVRMKHYCCNIM